MWVPSVSLSWVFQMPSTISCVWTAFSNHCGNKLGAKNRTSLTTSQRTSISDSWGGNTNSVRVEWEFHDCHSLGCFATVWCLKAIEVIPTWCLIQTAITLGRWGLAQVEEMSSSTWISQFLLRMFKGAPKRDRFSLSLPPSLPPSSTPASFLVLCLSLFPSFPVWFMAGSVTHPCFQASTYYDKTRMYISTCSTTLLSPLD